MILHIYIYIYTYTLYIVYIVSYLIMTYVYTIFLGFKWQLVWVWIGVSLPYKEIKKPRSYPSIDPQASTPIHNTVIEFINATGTYWNYLSTRKTFGRNSRPTQQPETFAKLLMIPGLQEMGGVKKQYDVKSASWMLNDYIIYTHIFNILNIYILYDSEYKLTKIIRRSYLITIDIVHHGMFFSSSPRWASNISNIPQNDGGPVSITVMRTLLSSSGLPAILKEASSS